MLAETLRIFSFSDILDVLNYYFFKYLKSGFTKVKAKIFSGLGVLVYWLRCCVCCGREWAVWAFLA